MKKPFDPDKISKDRRNWLEIFGNQWGSRRFDQDDIAVTPEEKQALADALNPFHK